jgi:pseudaminic acid cytidylyltransferase
MTRRLAVVPARGGSKRIPDKNIKEFAGHPMMAHILHAARESRLFDVIHVTTESPRIAAVTENLGFKVHFMRPTELADDQTPLMPVLRYVTETFAVRGETFDEVWLLMACAPLIEAEDLIGAASLYAETGGQWAVLSVIPYPVPIEWAFERDAGGRLRPTQPGKFAIRSQDLCMKYYDAGTFCGFPVRRVLKSTGAGDDTGFVGYVLPRHKAIDIDTQEDWQFAEILFTGLKHLSAGKQTACCNRGPGTKPPHDS